MVRGGKLLSAEALRAVPRRVHEREDALLFLRIFERVENADFIDAPGAVQRIEEERVARGQLGRLQVASAQVRIGVGVRVVPDKKVKAQPAAVGARS